MRPRPIVLLSLLLGLACLTVQAAQNPAGELVYIGARGNVGGALDGTAGIYAARLDIKSGHLSSLAHVIEFNRAQWLDVHPKLPVLYSVAGSSGGISAHSDIYSLAVDPDTGTLKVLNRVDSGGVDATHLAIDAVSQTLFVANHGSGTAPTPQPVAGTVGSLPLLPDGSLGAVASLQQDSGSGPNPRQRWAQAHCVAIDPSRHYLLVADLGADRVFINRFDAATRALTPAGAETLPAGSGPRHLAFHPNGRLLFVNTELSAELLVFTWDAKRGQLRQVQRVALYPADYAGSVAKSAAELVLSRDGRFAYLSLRGDQNSIVVYVINQRTGMLTELQRIASGGKSPASFVIDPTGRWLLASNELSDSVTLLKVDRGTGRLTATGESLSVPHPSAAVFYPR
jgi:6-phosphogluconolactonase